jgi:YVTN family beta-propeller protein
MFVRCGRDLLVSDPKAPPDITRTISEPVEPEPEPEPDDIAPTSASAISVSPNGTLVAAVNPDSNSITVLNAITLEILGETQVGKDPRTLSFTPDSRNIIVANQGSGTISIVDIRNSVLKAEYLVGPRPYGVVNDGKRAYVTESVKGQVVTIALDSGTVERRISVGPSPTGLAINSAKQQLFVTHLFDGALTVLDTSTSEVGTKVHSGTEANISQFVAISPDGSKAYLPQTRSNVANTARLFDTTVFPIVNVFNIENLNLSVENRITLDTADEPVNMPFSVALSPDGKRIYISNAGSNDISVIDLGSNKGVAHISVGSNPRGIAITPNGSHLFVNNVLDGTVSVIDTQSFEIIRTVKVTDIPLPPHVLEGKKIFNSASSPLLTTDNWISCATCHFDGSMDKRTWLGFPDGPRNTPSLLGTAETLPLHWSGDFNELQDVEITIRKIQFGDGLIKGQAYDSLGTNHAGLSKKLDYLASYMASLTLSPSPYRIDTDLTVQGKTVFENHGCATCHISPLYADSRSHDVGTGDPKEEKNPHGTSTSFDTPTLRGIWATAPYFHDGSARTLEEVLQSGTTHDIASELTDNELETLVDFLRGLPFE